MLLKLIIIGVLLSLCLGGAVGLERDLLIESMWGEQETREGGVGDDTRITLCLRGGGGEGVGGEGGQCRGVLAHPRLVLVRSACIRNQPLHKVHMFPTTEKLSCDDTTVLLSDKMRRVVSCYFHPSYYKMPSQNNIALLSINRPYDMDIVEHNSSTYSLLQKFNPWINYMKNIHQPVYMTQHRHTSLGKLFLMVVILPIFLFVLFFLYVTSGTTQDNHREGRTVY